jgi:hypothetical protein
MAIWLASRPQQPDFTRGLVRFTRTGAITQALKMQLRFRARSATYPHRPQTVRLMQYAVARGTELGPIGTDFAVICDRIDQADSMLAGLRDRVREGRGLPEPTWPDTDGQRLIALARRDPDSRMISLILDASTASVAMHAIAAHAGDREAHVREVEHYSQELPEDSWGRRNRQTIVARETRVAARLRAVERAYRTAIDRDAIASLEPVVTLRSADMARDHELEME